MSDKSILQHVLNEKSYFTSDLFKTNYNFSTSVKVELHVKQVTNRKHIVLFFFFLFFFCFVFVCLFFQIDKVPD